jgi:hypothetical protein
MGGYHLQHMPLCSGIGVRVGVHARIDLVEAFRLKLGVL